MKRRLRTGQDNATGNRRTTGLATPLRWSGAFRRRGAIAGALMVLGLLALFAMTSRSDSTLTASTLRTPTNPAPSVSTGAAPADRRSTTTRYQLAPGGEAVNQAELRSVVLGLSQCLSRLSPQRDWTLLLRSGIATPQPYSRRAVARIYHIGLAREAGIERAGLRGLQTAARTARCGRPLVLVHVPRSDRLVPVDAALTQPPQPAAPADVPALVRARLRTIRHREARLSFTVSAPGHGAAIRTIALALPSGITISPSSARLESGVGATRGGGRRVTLIVASGHRTLTLRLTSPATTVQVRIAHPALTVSRALARAIRTHRQRTLHTHIVTTDTNHRTTRLNVTVHAR